jgi:hypothetical protein
MHETRLSLVAPSRDLENLIEKTKAYIRGAKAPASQASTDRYHRNKFHRLALGLREFSLPLSRIASLLERGGER